MGTALKKATPPPSLSLSCVYISVHVHECGLTLVTAGKCRSEDTPGVGPCLLSMLVGSRASGIFRLHLPRVETAGAHLLFTLCWPGSMAQT